MKAAALSFDVVLVHWKDNEPVYKALEEFASTRIWGKSREFGIGQAMAISKEGKIIAVVVFNNYDPETEIVEISAASDSRLWLTRPILKQIFDFAFIDLKCQAVVARGDINNLPVMRIFPAYGFKKYEIPRLQGRNKTQAIFVLSDDDWRSNKFNQPKFANSPNKDNAAL